MPESDARDLSGAGQHVVCKRRRERLAVLIERHFLKQRGSDSLSGTTDGLSFDDHRVNPAPAVLRYDVVENLDRTEIAVDLDYHAVRTVAVLTGVYFGLESRSDLHAGRIDTGRQPLWGDVPNRRNVTYRDVPRLSVE